MEESFGLVLGWNCRPNLAQIRGFFLSCYLTSFGLFHVFWSLFVETGTTGIKGQPPDPYLDNFY